MIRIDTCHAQATDAPGGGANTTDTLGGDGFAPDSTTSMVESTLAIVVDGAAVGMIRRRSREDEVGFPQ
jgi:hypothetical protein